MSSQSRRQRRQPAQAQPAANQTASGAPSVMGPLHGPVEPEPEPMPMLTALATMWPGWGTGPVESWAGETQSTDMTGFDGGPLLDEQGQIRKRKSGGTDTQTISSGAVDRTDASTDSKETTYQGADFRSFRGNKSAYNDRRGTKSSSTYEGTASDAVSLDKTRQAAILALAKKLGPQSHEDLQKLETASLEQVAEIAKKHSLNVGAEYSTASKTTEFKKQDRDINVLDEASFKDLSKGGMNQTTTSVEHDGTKTVDSHSDTTTTRWKDGVHRERTKAHSKSVTRNAKGAGRYGSDVEKTSTDSTTTSTRKGVKMSEESGVGGAYGKSGKVVRGPGSAGASGDASLTTKGIDATGKGELGYDKDGVKLGASLSPSGKLIINVTYDAVKDLYKVTTSINIGASGTVGGSKDSTEDPSSERDKSGGSGSLGFRGSIGRAYTATRLLTPTEAKAYLGDVNKVDKGEGVPTRPEFGIFQRWCAGLPLVGLSVDADQAKMLGSGEEITIEDTGSAGFTVGGKGKSSAKNGNGADSITVLGQDTPTAGSSLGGSYGKDRTFVRRLSVKNTVTTEPDDKGKVGVPVVAVTVSLMDTSKTSLSAAVQDGVSKSTVGKHWSEGKGRTVVFHLERNESFEENFNKISAVRTTVALEKLAKELGPAEFTNKKTRGQGNNGTASIPLVSFGANDEQSFEDTTTLGKKGKLLKASSKGVSKQGASFDVAGILGQSSEKTQTGEATVDKDGLALKVTSQSKESTTSKDHLYKGIDKALGAFGKKNLEDKAGSLGSLANGGVKGALKKALTETRTTLAEVKLTPAQSKLLAGRAHNTGAWSRCAGWARPDVSNAWEDLGHRLRVNTVPKSLLDEIMAEKRALSDGKKSVSKPRGEEWDILVNLARARAFSAFVALGKREPLDNAVFRFGDGFGNTDSIASITEWPESIASTKTAYEVHIKSLKAVEAKAPKQREAKAMATLDAGLSKVRDTVEGCADFTEIRAQTQLLKAIDEQRTRLFQAQREKQGVSSVVGPLPEGEMRPSELARQTDAWTFARTERRIRFYGRQEKQLLRKAATAQRDRGIFASAPILKRIYDLHDVWEDELRAGREQADAKGKTLRVREPDVASRKAIGQGDPDALKRWAPKK